MNVGMRSGQAALEYILSLAALLVVSGILFVFVSVVQRTSSRNDTIVSGEYP